MVVEVHKKTIVRLKSVQSLHFQGCAEQPQGQTCREMSCCSVLLGREIVLLVDAGGIQPVAPGDGGRCWGTSRALWTQLLGTAAHSSQQQASSTTSSFLELLGRRQAVLLCQSQLVRSRAGKASSTSTAAPCTFLLWFHSSGCHRRKPLIRGRFLCWKTHLCCFFLFSQIFIFNPLHWAIPWAQPRRLLIRLQLSISQSGY